MKAAAANWRTITTLPNAEKIKKGILKAIEFESLYLQNKSDFYDRMANEDKARLKAISKRI